MALQFLYDGYFAGKVGIGTESPGAKLHVNPTTTDEIAIAINGTQNYSNNNFQRISAGDANSINRLSIGFGYTNPTEWAIRYSSYGRHEFYTGNDWGSSTSKMVITSTGNVGIGTTGPSGLLHLSSTSPSIYIEDTDATNTYNITRINGAGGNLSFDTRRSSDGGFVSTDYQIVKGSTGADYQRWFTVGAERMRITSAGGISFGSTGTAYGTSGQILKSNGNASPTWIDGSAIPGVPGGSGTLNTVAMWTPDGDTLGNGPITFNGNNSTLLGIVKCDAQLGVGSAPTNTFSILSGSGQVNMEFGTDSTSTFIQAYNRQNSVYGALRFVTNGETMRITNTGNVGIGTSTPAAKLQVIESGSNNTAIFENSGQTYSYTAIKVAEALNNKAALSFAVGNALASTDIFGEISGSVTNNGGALTGDLVFKTNPGDNITERMRILANGNVGIGTPSPGSTLTISGPSSNQFQIINSANSKAWRPNVNGNDFYITESGVSNPFVIQAGGNVGLGTTSPTEKLEVVGNIKITAAVLSNQENADVDTGTETVAEFSAAAFTAGFFDFVIKKTTNVRSGTVYACHDGTTVQFTETSTQDLGDTSDVTLSVDISGGNMRLRATTTSDDWSIKSLIRAI